MKITQLDLEGWREDTLNLANKMSLDESILKELENISLKVIPGNSYPLFYGYADCFFDDKKIEVYETNPSKYFPRKIQEVWNQSGMDHELIGHLYNAIANLDLSEESARKTQRKMIKLRSKESLLWKFSGLILDLLLSFKDKKQEIKKENHFNFS